MSVEFDTPANRVIAQQQPKNQFGIQLLPDIAFLRQLAIQGRLVFLQGRGDVNIDQDVLTFVPANGSTFFWIGGGCMNQSASQGLTVTLSNDGNIREEYVIPPRDEGNFFVSFQMKMDALVGDGVKSFTVHQNTGELRVSIFGWTENTSRIRDVTT